MMKHAQNNSKLFALFSQNGPDRLGQVLQGIGAICFGVSFFSLCGLVILEKGNGEGSQAHTALTVLAISGWALGLLVFVATGIHYLRTTDQSFARAGVGVLGKTLLFVLLPALFITLVLVVWATATKQPAFR